MGRIGNVNLGSTCCDNIIAGPTGPQGPTGESGIGPQGPSGSQGPPGEMGFQGNPGTGVQGPQGRTGELGPQGVTGPEGPAGFAGKEGVRGPTGPPGAGVGPEGPRGPTGSQGATGTGTIGLSGERGATGPEGPTGIAEIAFGNIFRNELSPGFFLAGSGGNLVLISSQFGAASPCNGSIAWTTNGNFNMVTPVNDVVGQPVQFRFSVPGIYLFTYDISFSFGPDDGSQTYRFVAQANNVSIPGSESQITIILDQSIYHISHSFTAMVLEDTVVGIHAEAVGSPIPLCTTMHDGSFTTHLINPM